MTFELFKNIIISWIRFEKDIDALYAMHINVYDSELYYTPGYLLDRIWDSNFEDEAVDLINWWAFEYHDLGSDFDYDGKCLNNLEPRVFIDDKPISTNTIEEIWEQIKNKQLWKK